MQPGGANARSSERQLRSSSSALPHHTTPCAAVAPLLRCRRPSIVISYLVSGLTALLAACCFGELCVE